MSHLTMKCLTAGLSCILLVLAWGSVLAQGEGSVGGPTVEQIERRVAALEESTTVDPAIRAEALQQTRERVGMLRRELDQRQRDEVATYKARSPA